jgi:cytoskeleton protein RodZ
MDERETLGSYLKNLRESKRVSLREVARITRVREHILRAIEEDQHHLLPPATYVKGFLLAYAKYLRLDPNDVLLRYQRVLKGASVTTTPPQPPKPNQRVSPTQPTNSGRRILWNTKQTWVVAGVIAASLIIFYFFWPYPSKPPVEHLPEKAVSEEKPPLPSSPPPVTVAAPVQQEKPVGEVEPPHAPSVAATSFVLEKKPFSLKLKAVEEAWVSLQVDDESQREMTFKPGEGISVQASNRVRMIIGNAGGTELIFNGKALERFGKSGEVVTLTLTSQGMEVKHHEKPKSP